MSGAELRIKFPNASPSFIRANATDSGQTDFPPGIARSPAELERHPGHGTLGAPQIQAKTGRRVLVRVTSFRRRLLDEDNLCEKYHVDLCRYAGILPSDQANKAKIEVLQEKIKGKELEFTRIEIFDT